VTPDATVASPTREHNRIVIRASCTRHGGARGFTNVLMTKTQGAIVLDPHLTGGCVLELDELEATAMRDQLTKWLG
jgi:hypothetical protein